MTATRPHWIAWLLAGAGLLLCLALTARSLGLAAHDDPGGFDLCGAVFETGCDATLSADDAVLLGLPWAGWGLAYFTALLLLLALAAAPRGDFVPTAPLAAFALACVGALFGIVLTARMVFGPTPACPLCTAVHAASLCLVPLLWRACALSPRQARALLTHAGRVAIGLRAGSNGRSAAPHVVALGLVLLAGTVILQRVHMEWRLRTHPQAQADLLLDDALRRWRAAPSIDPDLRPDDPRLGRHGAPAEVVVFSSLQCPGCAEALAFLVDLRARVGRDLTVVFKHFPLGTECNTGVESDVHPLACAAARAAEAARLQGQFWAYHDAVQGADLADDEDALTRAAREVGLDVARFERDRRAESAASRVEEDVATGRGLGLHSTPSIFLNTRRVEDLHTGVIEHLVRHAIPDARR